MTLRLVLVNPKIPPNTGNIARTCAATGTPLHLVGPLGFEISDRHLKRAGLDYWPHVDLTLHPDWVTFDHHQREMGGRRIGFSVRGTEDYHRFEFCLNDWLLMGSETEGLSEDNLASCDHLIRIPMNQTHVRSLNLSVSAAIGLFEARRQLGLLG